MSVRATQLRYKEWMVIQRYKDLGRITDWTVMFHQFGLESTRVAPTSSCFRIEGRGIVGFAKQRLQGEQYRLNAVNSRPFILKDIKTDCASVDVNVRVITRGVEFDRRRYIWVIRGERDRDFKCESRVNSLRRPLYCPNPLKKIAVMFRECRNARG